MRRSLAQENAELYGRVAALELFDWFGIRGYVLPRLDQVPFGGGADDTMIIEVA
jgi:hypothetical protein